MLRSRLGTVAVAAGCCLLGASLAGCTRPNPGYDPKDGAAKDTGQDTVLDTGQDTGLAQDASGDQGWTIDGRHPRSCLELQEELDAPTGTYTINPGSGAIEVACNMAMQGGGWTRVGWEAAGGEGTFLFLGKEVGEPSALANRLGNGLIGVRFADLYAEILIRWRVPEGVWSSIRGTVADEVFANHVNTSIPIEGVVTTDPNLQAWIAQAGGAVLCRASSAPDVRPGGSSWAIKPSDDRGSACGCNDVLWVGRGGFYSGARDSTTCATLGGGWAGVKNNGEVKSGLAVYETEIWIR